MIRLPLCAAKMREMLSRVNTWLMDGAAGETPEKTAETKLVKPGTAKITKPAATEKAATGKTTAKAAKGKK